jgi:hypothetical protein
MTFAFISLMLPSMADREIPSNTVLLMAALIAAVRTARFNASEFEGANSPRIMSEVYQSLQLARLVYRRADELKIVEL